MTELNDAATGPVAVDPSPPDAATVAGPRPWGFWASLGWVILISLFSQVCGVILTGVLLGFPGIFEWNFFTRAGIVAMPFFLISFVGCIRLRGYRDFRDYMALRLPSLRGLLLWLVLTFVVFVLYDLVQPAVGAPIVPEIQREIYMALSSLPILWLAVVIVAPITEEVIFRGFLFTGWAASRLGATGACALTALGFGVLHADNGAFGILGACIFGLLAGAARVKTNSLYLCIIMHAQVNVYSSIVMILTMSGEPAQV